MSRFAASTKEMQTCSTTNSRTASDAVSDRRKKAAMIAAFSWITAWAAHPVSVTGFRQLKSGGANMTIEHVEEYFGDGIGVQLTCSWLVAARNIWRRDDRRAFWSAYAIFF